MDHHPALKALAKEKRGAQSAHLDTERDPSLPLGPSHQPLWAADEEGQTLLQGRVKNLDIVTGGLPEVFIQVRQSFNQ